MFFQQLGKNATLPKIRKNAPKKPVRSSISVSDTRGDNVNNMSGLHDEPLFLNSRTGTPCMENESSNTNGAKNEINVEKIYNVIQEVSLSCNSNNIT